MIPARLTADSLSNVPVRPPKSPSSHVLTSLKNTNVIMPRSPPRPQRSKILPHDWQLDKPTNERDHLSNALSPTSVIDSKDSSSSIFAERPPRTRESERRKRDGKPSVDSARNLVDAGSACMKEGNQVGALFAFELLLDERMRKYGPHHVMVGSAFNNVGMVHLHFCDYGPAEKCFARAATIQNRSKEAHPLDVVASLVNLGQVRLLLGKRHGARTVFLDAIRIIRTKIGCDHILVAEFQNQIGYLLFENSDLPEALRAFADALAVYRSLLKHDETNSLYEVALSEVLCSMGSIQLEQKNFDLALEYFYEALQRQRETVGDFHPSVIVTLDNLAFVHTKKRDYEKALKYYNETLQAQVAFYGEYNHECAETKKKEQLVFKKYSSSRHARDRAFTA